LIARSYIKYGVGIYMKGIIIIPFFLIFAAASLLIPIPIFPGSWFCAAIGSGIQEYVVVFSAVLNGLFYGSILWLIFIGLSIKLTESE
jgi:hypothetical protein